MSDPAENRDVRGNTIKPHSIETTKPIASEYLDIDSGGVGFSEIDSSPIEGTNSSVTVSLSADYDQVLIIPDNTTANDFDDLRINGVSSESYNGIDVGGRFAAATSISINAKYTEIVFSKGNPIGVTLRPFGDNSSAVVGCELFNSTGTIDNIEFSSSSNVSYKFHVYGVNL